MILSIIPPAHLAVNIPKIIKAKPHLEKDLTNTLLAIDNTHHKEERKRLIKGYILDALSKYFQNSALKKEILDFAQKNKNNLSPKGKKAAAKLLDQ